MKNKTIICMIVAMFAIMASGIAQSKTGTQTKSKKQTKTTTKKTETKAIKVYVCSSKKDKFFHKYSSCKQLNNCAGEIKYLTSATELKKFKRKSCTHCFNLK